MYLFQATSIFAELRFCQLPAKKLHKEEGKYPSKFPDSLFQLVY